MQLEGLEKLHLDLVPILIGIHVNQCLRQLLVVVLSHSESVILDNVLEIAFHFRDIEFLLFGYFEQVKNQMLFPVLFLDLRSWLGDVLDQEKLQHLLDVILEQVFIARGNHFAEYLGDGVLDQVIEIALIEDLENLQVLFFVLIRKTDETSQLLNDFLFFLFLKMHTQIKSLCY